MSMHIKKTFGVEDLFFYQLIKVDPDDGGKINTCSIRNFDLDLGSIRQYSTGVWRQDLLEEGALKIVLQDLQKNKGQIYFLDTKTHYQDLRKLLKDYYMLVSIYSNMQADDDKYRD